MRNKRVTVPAYSQVLDVEEKFWQSRADGIVALKIVMDFWGVETPSIDVLIKIGIGLRAYEREHGWNQRGLAKIAKLHGLRAEQINLRRHDPVTALRKLRWTVGHAPVLTSIRNKRDDTDNGHLIVVKRITGTKVFFNDPCVVTKTRKSTRRTMSVDEFLRWWIPHLIIIKP